MDQERRSGYEPGRISPSVFAATMTPKQEWSIQSNESLFSIHMGDQSFSTMYKSGELSNSDYIASYTNNNINNKTAVTDVATKEVNVASVETGPKTANQDRIITISKPDPPQQIPISPTKSYRSDTSNNSVASFAFPTLPEYQQDRRRPPNLNSGSGKTEISKGEPKHDLYSNDPNPAGGAGWLSCFFCFSVKS